MAIAKGFTTLMMHHESKEKFLKAKAKMEKQLGVSLTHSNALEIMADQILSDSTKLSLRIVPMEE